MPRLFGNYSTLFERIEQTFSIDEMTPENLKEYLGVDTSRRMGLAEELSQVSILNDEIDSLDNIADLKQLKREILRQPIFKFQLLNRADEKIEQLEIEERERKVAESISRAEEFARSKRITFSERIIGREENWRGFEKKKLVIRGSDGRFITWKNA